MLNLRKEQSCPAQPSSHSHQYPLEYASFGVQVPLLLQVILSHADDSSWAEKMIRLNIIDMCFPLFSVAFLFHNTFVLWHYFWHLMSVYDLITCWVLSIFKSPFKIIGYIWFLKWFNSSAYFVQLGQVFSSHVQVYCCV